MGELSPLAKVLQGGALVYCSDHVAVGLPANVEGVAALIRQIQARSTLRPPCRISVPAASTSCTSRRAHASMGPLIAAGLVDELLVYLAPKLLGRDAREMFSLAAPDKLADAIQFDLR